MHKYVGQHFVHKNSSILLFKLVYYVIIEQEKIKVDILRNQKNFYGWSDDHLTKWPQQKLDIYSLS